MAPSSLCVVTLAAGPPAHCRLVSGHDPFGMVAYSIVPLGAEVAYNSNSTRLTSDRLIADLSSFELAVSWSAATAGLASSRVTISWIAVSSATMSCFGAPCSAIVLAAGTI